jgi:hypothetical protein
MSSDARLSVFFVLALASIATATSASTAKGQLPKAPATAPGDSEAQADLSRIIAGILSDTSSHMRMGPTRTATMADSARAAAVVAAARAALSQYVDVKVAERDGYYRNMPWLDDQPIYHYNSAENANAAERGKFDPSRPVSLLYKKNDRGQLNVVGAMYATSASAAPDSLDALLPVSMAHWHQHVNLCYPGKSIGRYLTGKVDAGLVFVMKTLIDITSAPVCEAAGGRFVSSEAGWMAHVYMFPGSNDAKAIWDADDIGSMGMRMTHPPADLQCCRWPRPISAFLRRRAPRWGLKSSRSKRKRRFECWQVRVQHAVRHHED